MGRREMGGRLEGEGKRATGGGGRGVKVSTAVAEANVTGGGKPV